jgi:hypothetical protein
MERERRVRFGNTQQHVPIWTRLSRRSFENIGCSLLEFFFLPAHSHSTANRPHRNPMQRKDPGGCRALLVYARENFSGVCPSRA